MKTFILIFFILAISIIIVLKLVTSTGPEAPPGIPMSYSNRYDTENEIYQDNNDSIYQQNLDTEITDHKLMAFARAFVEVQSYMNEAGNRSNYKKTRQIVQNHGLSVEDYTKIATQMNAHPDLQSKVLKMINGVNF